MFTLNPELLMNASVSRRLFVQILGGTTIAAALETSVGAQVPRGLPNGERRLLECLGTGPGGRIRLDGNTVTGAVSLQRAPQKPFTGMWWRVVHLGGDTVAFECMGDKPGNRWLDGNTMTGAVGLAPHTREPFTGTRWQPVLLNKDNHFALRCLGRNKTDRQWLDGNTMSGAVTLAATTEPPFTGTRWRAAVIID